MGDVEEDYEAEVAEDEEPVEGAEAESDSESDSEGEGESDSDGGEEGLGAEDADQMGRMTEERFNWPGPLWSAGRPDGAHPADEEVIRVPDAERTTSDTLSIYELAKVCAVMANHERSADNVVHGAMRKVYSGRTPLTVVRTVSVMPAVYAADGTLKSRGKRWVEVWRVAELHNPHPLPAGI
jgi:hypothetical protein